MTVLASLYQRITLSVIIKNGGVVQQHKRQTASSLLTQFKLTKPNRNYSIGLTLGSLFTIILKASLPCLI
jgi:hypothetical protein